MSINPLHIDEEKEILEIISLVKDLRSKFTLIESKPWSFKKGCMELLVQIGHLVQAFMVTTNKITQFHEKGRKLINVEDEIADCIFQVIALMLFLQFQEDQILEVIQKKIPLQDETEILFNLFITGSQLLEANMRIEGDRFAHSRKPFYDSEYEFIKQKLTESLALLKAFSDLRCVKISSVFQKMHIDATTFLKGYQHHDHANAKEQYETLKNIFNPQAFDL